jgi:predicted kinase
MMVGLPGSGKSTYAEKLSKEHKAIICSSDKIREELYSDENTQTNNDEVFKLLHRRIKALLQNGTSVIYDATNINSKRRRAFLAELRNIPCNKICVIMATPFDKCCEWNDSRNRVVPYEVIKRMYKNWNTPYWFEGWNEIVIKTKNDDYKLKDISVWLYRYIEYDQENPHHLLSLGKHCELVGKQLMNDALLECAGYLHDCGKPFTKSFTNSKGEIKDIAHYYQHHCIGAYDSLFFDYSEGVNKLDVSILVNLHMQPYFWEKDKEHGQKIRQNYEKLWGEELYNNVMRLHEADVRAH